MFTDTGKERAKNIWICLTQCHLVNSIEQCLKSEANTASRDQDIPCLLLKTKDHLANTHQPAISSYIDPVELSHNPISLRPILILSFYLCLGHVLVLVCKTDMTSCSKINYFCKPTSPKRIFNKCITWFLKYTALISVVSCSSSLKAEKKIDLTSTTNKLKLQGL